MSVKQEILSTLDQWIEATNDEICCSMPHVNDPLHEKIVRSSFDRRVMLQKFKLDFARGSGYDLNILAQIVETIVELEEDAEASN
jgi:hypothetical protein